MVKTFPPTIIIRHRKENLKKCSLQGLENRSDFMFFPYPLKEVPFYSSGYTLLSVDAPQELSFADQENGLLILDATWRYAKNMQSNLPQYDQLHLRSLPPNFITAYPRRQLDCCNPKAGLASIEAIFCAYIILGRSVEGLLDQYYWKDSFLEKNNSFLLECIYHYERKASSFSSA